MEHRHRAVHEHSKMTSCNNVSIIQGNLGLSKEFGELEGLPHPGGQPSGMGEGKG